MERDARFWKEIDKQTVKCSLCAHGCKIKNGQKGICGVRKNVNGKLKTLIYGSVSSMAVDPIEKKPLFHFYPGSQVFSLGTVGCNFKCLNCQNYDISTANHDSIYIRDVMPERAVELAKSNGCQGIAWTYNEPTIWHEYTFDSAKLAKSSGLYTAYVTNGYISRDALMEISPYLDAMNVDVKSFNENFYNKICKAKLGPVIKTCELAKELKIHLEVTYLVIPGYNDDLEEIKRFCKWVVEKLGKDTAVHFSRFHPDYKMMEASITPFETLYQIFKCAKEVGILFPYIGNVPHGEYENTFCPSCGKTCIERYGFTVSKDGLNEDKCVNCGKKLPIILEN
ncbi:MAG: AmmeMemoRadiSam system radical SAM enzyme [Candidatus Thermoplasmatota archaeon]|nr:AmmeMemoRadiSam system radical SAM enzyme [Candidatus Thermoplasmatota archaeon]